MESLTTKLADAVRRLDFDFADNLCMHIVDSNWIIPLILMIQQPDSSEREELALQLLELLIQYVDVRLSAEGWHVDENLCDIYGDKWYFNDLSGAQSSDPCLKESFWQFELLQSLPILIVPGQTADGSLLWAVEVVSHSVPIDNVMEEMAAFLTKDSPQWCKQRAGHISSSCFSLLNTLKFSDDVPAAADCAGPEVPATTRGRCRRKGKGGRGKALRGGASARSDEEGEWVLMRQLVVGRWDGATATPCMEVARPAPAMRAATRRPDTSVHDAAKISELETWHETTLAAVALAGIAARRTVSAQSSPSRVLLVGSSLAAVTAFLGNLLSVKGVQRQFALTLVEGIGDVCTSAELKEFLNDCLGRTSDGGASGAPGVSTAGDAVEVTVLTTRPSEFVSATEKGSYDAILIGVGCSMEDSALWLAMLQPWGALAVAVREQGSVSDCSQALPDFITRLGKAATSINCMVYRLHESSLTDSVSAATVQGRYVVYACLPKASDGPGRGVTVEWWLESMHSLNSPVTADECVPDLIPVSASARALPLAMDVFAAQKTSAVRIPALVSVEEAAAIHALAGRRVVTGDGGAGIPLPDAARRIGREMRSKDSHLWEVLFLQTEGVFYSALPELLEKATRAVCKVDLDNGWGLLSAGPFSVRVVEYHTQNAPSGAIGDTHHYDQDSLVTLDIMLSEPGVDFVGADIQTLEAESGLITHFVNKYDALCFVSHKYHSVKPLLRGRRVVCVLEFWRGSPLHRNRTCPHRCLAVNKACTLETGLDNEVASIGSIAPPFTLAAARHQPNPAACSSPDARHWFGGDVGIFWQATVASEGVDDKRAQLIVPLSDAATQELNDMFGDD
jgi:hypothetical protein